jgi:hypothetical protein
LTTPNDSSYDLTPGRLRGQSRLDYSPKGQL